MNSVAGWEFQLLNSRLEGKPRLSGVFSRRRFLLFVSQLIIIFVYLDCKFFVARVVSCMRVCVRVCTQDN